MHAVRLFDYKFVYPSDDYGGRYVELEGEVISTYSVDDDLHCIEVRTDKGDFSGYIEHGKPAKIGTSATIRIYDAGGGWYPDNKIVSWSTMSHRRISIRRPHIYNQRPNYNYSTRRKHHE